MFAILVSFCWMYTLVKECTSQASGSIPIKKYLMRREDVCLRGRFVMSRLRELAGARRGYICEGELADQHTHADTHGCWVVMHTEYPQHVREQLR